MYPATAEDAGGSKLSVVIASANRPQMLHETLVSLGRQRLRPAQILVAAPGEEHVLAASRELPRVAIVKSEIGSSRQRNRAIAAVSHRAGVVTFLDDDVELHDDYLGQIARLFEAEPDLILVDGTVLADGAASGVILRAQAAAMLAKHVPPLPTFRAIGAEHAYGCNMSVRRHALGTVRFDERLALYGYMEDRDFATQCAKLGGIARCDSAVMVHLGTAAGRVSGRRFGFSQVMNPLYLWRKGTLGARQAARKVLPALAVNAALALAPGQTVDRRGRLIGNCRALALALRGRIAPEDVARL